MSRWIIAYDLALSLRRSERLESRARSLGQPRDNSFGIGVIAPRWLFVLAAATPARYGDPVIADETLEPFVPVTVQAGDVVGIGIHTANALRGFDGPARERLRRVVVYGGIHATLYPEEPRTLGNAGGEAITVVILGQ